MTIDNSNQYKTLTTRHSYDAPVEVVWQAWTDPKEFAKWWSPDTFTTPICELDVRPEGELRIEMLGPDGVKYPTIGRYKEVINSKLLSFVNSPMDANGNKLFEALQTVEFKKIGDQTELIVTSNVLSATPGAESYLDGMEPGIKQALDKLENVLQK